MTTTYVELTGLPVDQRGHRFLWRYAKTQTLDATINLIGERDILSGFVSVYGGVGSCDLCDAYAGFTIVENPDGIEHEGGRYGLRAKTACTLPEGQDMVFELAVPSGRIIVNDSLSPIFHVELREEVDVPGYNSVAGQALHVAEQAAIGCAYGPVGNSSPSLVRVGEDKYVIASFDDEAAPGQEGELEGEVLAHVCTDLWAYSIADYEDWLTKATTWIAEHDDEDRDWRGLLDWVAGGSKPEDKPWTVSVVDVTPGTYRFTHHSGRADFDPDGPWPRIYAHVERLPDEPEASA